jgi:hypothetical protein
MTQPSLLDLPQTVYSAHRAEVSAERVRLASAADRVLAALQTGPKTNLELIALCQRISGRVFDLRRRGYRITTEAVAPGVYRYALVTDGNGAVTERNVT